MNLPLYGVPIRSNGFKRINEYQMNNTKMKKKKLENELNALVIHDLFSDDEEEETVMINTAKTNTKLNETNKNQSRLIYINDSNNNKWKQKGKLQYKNGDKTLTEKFVTKFTDKLQKELDVKSMRNQQLQLLKNREQKKFDFLDGLRSFSEEVDNIEMSPFPIIIKDRIQDNTQSTALFLTKTDNYSFHNNKNSFIETNYSLNNINETYKSNMYNNLASNKKNSYTQSDLNSDGLKDSSSFKNLHKSCPFEESNLILFSPVSIKFPKLIKRVYPLKINNLTKNLNQELSRLSRGYGKTDAFKRFKENPVSQHYFDTNNYLAYRTSKISENKDLFRTKLKPLLVEKEPGLEKMANSLFIMRNNIIKTIREVTQN